MDPHGEGRRIVRVDAGGGETLARIKGVIAGHLDRFAFREAPMAVVWRSA